MIDGIVQPRGASARNFNFGELHVQNKDERSVSFYLSGYTDAPASHAYMIAGWAAAAAQLSGAAGARGKVLNLPSQAQPELVYRVSW